MFYISKASPLMFIVAIVNLLLSLIIKAFGGDLVLFFVSLVFGFVGTTLIGAMYQIIPNSQNRRLSAYQVSYAVFTGILLSLILFYFHMYKTASVLMFLSYVTFFIHLVLNVKNWMPVTVKFLGVSATYLTLSSLFLFLHFIFGVVPLQLAVHTLTIGSMLNAVYGVEIAWIPMLLMETLSIRKAQKLFYAKQISTVFILIPFYLLSYRLIALASLLELGVAIYYIYLIYSLIQHRRMPSPLPYVVKMFLVALVFLPIGFIMGAFTASNPEVLPISFNLHIDFLIYGFTAFTIFGGMAHLFPRIMWNWKFASRKGDRIPTVNELIDEPSFPKFMELSLIAFVFFLAVDSLFFPLKAIAALLYIFIIGMFFKITFLHFMKKLKEVENGSS